ncbi:MAG: RNase adaptor protein RapZ, partial [Acidobacteriota bacterium]|nr:RNase adaptor protein RapZ [Acidobacteriota bacterium]
EVLVRRFSETRRPHTLATDRPVLDGIQAERALLAPLRSRADLVIDTGEWSVHDLRKRVFQDFASDQEAGAGLVVSVTSFGFKHGIPRGTDLLVDVRFLSNPHFVPGLREQSGLDLPVREYLEAQAEFGELRQRLGELLLYLLPKYQRETRSYLAFAVGCTGGRHRSVAMAEAIGETLTAAGWPVQLNHRDIERSE